MGLMAAPQSVALPQCLLIKAGVYDGFVTVVVNQAASLGKN